MFNNASKQTQDDQQPQGDQAVQQHEEKAKIVHPPAPSEAPPVQAPDPAQTLAAVEKEVAGLSVPEPSADNSAAPTTATSAPEPSEANPHQAAGASHGDEASAGKSEELLSLKHKALAELSPLVPHLEQSPEERFRTLMMMIQASDDHTKIKEAYQAAKKIEDDKVRAQALLDVVNEINYFTQNSAKHQ